VKAARAPQRGFSLITFKLFALLALVSVLCVGATAWLFARHLESGFTGYLNDVQNVRLEAMSQAIVAHYRATGSLEALRGPEWRRILGDREPPGEGRHPPKKADWAHPKSDWPPPKGEHGPPKGDRPAPDAPGDFLAMGPRVSLETPEGFRIAGRRPPPGENVVVREVLAEGRPIARLVVAPLPRPVESRDVQFLSAQRRSILLTATAAVGVSLALAFLVAGLWVRRLRLVEQAAARFAAGKFEVRLSDSSHDEIGTLARSLNTMADSLARLEQARRKWLADIAHELRTPLTVLQGHVEALIDGVRPTTPAALQALSTEVRHLARLTDDLHQLALSDLKALPAEFRLLNVAAVAKQAVERWQPNAQKARLTLLYEGEDRANISADEGRLTQLIDNLLANSLRYTDTPGRVQLTVERGPDETRLVFDDSPPSVPVDARAALFEPLFRPDLARSRAQGGSGLGLALARAIVELHKGRIEASDSPLGGLRVVAHLPTARPS